MIKRTLAPGFRIALHQKDLNLALAGAAQLMQACAANGWGELDHSAVVRALEIMANHSVV